MLTKPDDILDISKIPTIAEYGPALYNNQMEESNDRISCKTLAKAKYRWKFDTTTILIFLLILSNAAQLAFYNNSQCDGEPCSIHSQTQGQLHNITNSCSDMSDHYQHEKHYNFLAKILPNRLFKTKTTEAPRPNLPLAPSTPPPPHHRIYTCAPHPHYRKTRWVDK